MADEITVRMSLQVVKDNLSYQSQPSSFRADLVGTAAGPTPGAIIVPTAGYDVPFTGLSTPGWVRLLNLDQTNFVQWGLYEIDIARFRPIGELGPGEQAVFKLSRNLQEEYSGSGTGTTGPENYFRLKADTAQCVVLVEAFEA